MNAEEFDTLIESICGKGCIEVNRTILLLEKKQNFPELEHLNASQRQFVLKELKSIMNVYDGKTCSI